MHLRAKQAVVLQLGPTGSSVRPSPAEVARAVAQARADARRAARDRLDAAFAYEMGKEAPRVRVDVGEILADLGDVEAWDAMDEPAEALAARLDAMSEDAAQWESLAWIEHEALPDLEWANGRDSEVDVAQDWKPDVDRSRRTSYRPGRSASGSCEEAGTSAPRTFR